MKSGLSLGTCSNALLDLHSLPTVEENIESNRLHVIETNSQLPLYVDGGSLDFYVEPSSTECICLLESYLQTELRVVKLDKNGKEEQVTEADKVSFIPFIANTMFKGVSLHINDEEIANTVQNYHAYESYVNVIMNLSRTAQRSLLSGAGLHLSDPGTMAFTDPTAQGADGGPINPGLSKRHELATVTYTDPSDFVTPLIWPLFMVPRVLPTKTELKLSLKLNSSEFCLIAAEEKKEEEDEENGEGEAGEGEGGANVTVVKPIPRYIIKIVKAKLNLQKYRLFPQALVKQEKMLTSYAKYPMTNNKTTCFMVDTNSTEVVKALTFASELPRMCYVFQVTRSSLNSIRETPFNFQTFNMGNLYLECDGTKYPNGVGYNQHWAHEYVNPHKMIMKELGYSNQDMCFDRFGWISGYGVFPINLVPDRSVSCDDYLSLPVSKSGNLNLHISYNKPTAVPIAVFVIMEYYNVLSLDTHRKPVWIK